MHETALFISGDTFCTISALLAVFCTPYSISCQSLCGLSLSAGQESEGSSLGLATMPIWESANSVNCFLCNTWDFFINYSMFYLMLNYFFPLSARNNLQKGSFLQTTEEPSIHCSWALRWVPSSYITCLLKNNIVIHWLITMCAACLAFIFRGVSISIDTLWSWNDCRWTNSRREWRCLALPNAMAGLPSNILGW